MKSGITFGSLFAGIGGFDLGFERAGLICRWQVENNPFCVRVLQRHWPSTLRHMDICTFPPLPYVPDHWRCDVICGGFPCKQTSTISQVRGLRTGLEGKDSGLFYHMLRVLRLVRPRWVVIENVAGAKSWQGEIKVGLEAAGYRLPFDPVILSAEDFGAAHQRRRMFWVAHRAGKGLEAPYSQRGLQRPDSFEGRAVAQHVRLCDLPGAMRVDDGLPSRVDRCDRITALGNRVVPQITEYIGRYLVGSKGVGDG